MGISDRVFTTLFYLLLIILPFQRYVSIEVGEVKIRILHIVILSILLMIVVLRVIKNKKIYTSNKYFETCLLLILVLFINPYNYDNLYTYYLIFIIVTSYAVFCFMKYYNISIKKLLKCFPYIWMISLFFSFFTMERSWHGGLQMMSVSDFSIYYSMQLSAVFPFIFLTKNKIILTFIYSITLLLLGSRGPILMLCLIFLIFLKNRKLKILVALLLVLSSAIVFVIDPDLMKYYVAKIYFFNDEIYHNSSDKNRFLYIVATLTYPTSIIEFLFGHGVKYNKYIIFDFFSKFFDDTTFGINDTSTVHNLYLEMYSDVGIIGAFLVVNFLYKILVDYYLLYKKSDNKYIQMTFFSYAIFILDYLVEPNYVHFYFWIMVAIYLFSLQKFKKEILNEKNSVFYNCSSTIAECNSGRTKNSL